MSEEGCMKKFCSSLRDHATNAINFEKKKMLLLTKKDLKITPRCDSILQKKKIPQKVC